MPSLIPNYIARLRTQSQSTAASSSSQSGSRSNSTAGPPTPGPEHPRLAADPPTGQTENNLGSTSQTQVAQKIHPDLSALLNENAPPESVAAALGPPPPRGRSRSTGQLASVNQEIMSQGPDQGVAEADNKPLAASSATSRSPLLSRILSTPLLGGVKQPTSNADTEPDAGGLSTHWSTFGRRNTRASAVGEFGSLHRRGSGSRSSTHSKSSAFRPRAQISGFVTPTTTRPPSARASTVSRPQTTETQLSQPESPAGTISSSSGSKSHSAYSHSMRSRRLLQAHPEPIIDAEPPVHADPQTPAAVPYNGFAAASPFTPVSAIASSPKLVGPSLGDSPHTFGHATPKQTGASSRRYPALGGAFLPPLTSTPPAAEHQYSYSTREPSLTFPLRSGTRHIASRRSTISFPTLPFTRSQTRPRAEDVFHVGDRDRERRSNTFGTRFHFGSLESGEGEGTRRRKSADWSAVEAVRNEDGVMGGSWPASVSKEMVRLSLAGSGGRASAASVPIPVGTGQTSTEVGEMGTLQEEATKNPTLFGSTGEERWRFFRAGAKNLRTSSAQTAATSVAMSQPSQLHVPLGPAFLVSPPSGTSASGSRSGVEKGRREGGLAPHVSVTAPTPSTSPSGSRMGTGSHSGATSSNLNGDNSARSHGKRKIVDTEDEKPMEEHATRQMSNVLGGSKQSSTRMSDVSRAPSSYRHSKRIRLSTPSHSSSRERPSGPRSRPTSPASRSPSSLRTIPPHAANPRTLSHSSIPLRAIVSPRPPSIDRRSPYPMRDPTLPPPRRQSTQWTGSARRGGEDGRAFPLQGWAFIAGFLVFPFWWVAAVAPVGWGWGRRVRGMQDGKGIWAEEDLAARETWEHDVAHTWRRRCRLMSLFGLLVYVPLIVLLAVLVPRT